ncbi:MAG TPA: hypothetical protein PLM63_01010 [bacterium]|nr:hypothetical protein [Patescibacteria group bacterium]HOC96178.1 hypothetical protein [bacterium]HPO11150.1 hypothetical protein [bacterium]
MKFRFYFFFIIFIFLLFYSGCTINKKEKGIENSSVIDTYKSGIENTNINNKDASVNDGEEKQSGRILFICDNEDCFLEKFKVCSQAQFYVNDSRITYVILERVDINDTCRFIIDRIEINQKTLDCSVKNTNLDENLFYDFIGKNGDDLQYNFFKKYCKEIDI